jgi:hypothetical protein
LIEHWNGATWSVVPHPDDALKDSQVAGMTAIASNDVWAVGYYTEPITGYTRNLIEHWNGSAWSAVPISTFPQSEQLLAVAGRSANDVWAVGSYYDTSDLSNQHFSTEIAHWNGSSWSVVPSPNVTSAGEPATCWLTSVTAFASHDVWAVGYSALGTLAEHWDGAQWSIVPSPNTSAQQNQLFGVSGSAANDIWAVGSFYDQTGGPSGGPLIEHWDGMNWSIASAIAGPVTTHDQLLGVAAPRAGEAWAVGELTNNPAVGSSLPLLQRWNGLVWAAQFTPPLGASGWQVLSAVGAAADGTVIAVGYYPDPGNGNARTLAVLLGRRLR